MPLFVIETALSIIDYRKSLYVASFLRSKLSYLTLAALALIPAVLIGGGEAGLKKVFFMWIFFVALFLVICGMRLEMKFSKIARSDRTVTMPVRLEFMDDRIKVINKTPYIENEVIYDDLYEVLESKDFYFFYFTVRNGSPVKKADVENKEEFTAFLKKTFGRRYRKI